ncbi:putative GntR family transcriptional regulator [Oscillibacter valericigenes Sjm18-20]|nr:putative GntR family transcriptional regulator [Oscillibacter valericigenes Sjm18-20]
MPMNSFDDYPMSWKLDRRRLARPYYRSIADAMEHDVINGVLEPNTKLPPQRELADFLDVNLSTVTRAYKTCELKGLIYATIGKGTYVSSKNRSENVLLQNDKTTKIIELGTIQPFYQLNSIVVKTAQKLFEKPYAMNLLEYVQPLDSTKYLESARLWFEKFNLEISTDNIIFTSGGQNALSIALISLFQPGDKIAVDCYTYPNFIGLANLLRIQLIPIQLDDWGMLPEELERNCRTTNLKGIYLMPSCSNPTNLTMPMERRKQLATVIKRYDLILIEDDTYSFLLPGLYLPFAAQIPDQTVYICGTSKSICAGLRVAFMAFPDRMSALLSNGAYYANLKTPTVNIEIIAELITSGLADQIIEKKIQLAKERNSIYKKYFPDADHFNEISLFQWLALPGDIDSLQAESASKKQGVRILSSQKFAVGATDKYSHVRLATCSPKNVEELEKGLGIIRKIIDENSHIAAKSEFIV